MTVLIETPSGDLSASVDLSDGGPPAALTAELAWCLRRFVTARADELAMRRAAQALAAWDAWSGEVTINLP
jgi:hypothetical protein